MSDNAQNVLFQNHPRYGVNRLTLQDGRTLKIQKEHKSKTVSYLVDIVSLDSVSKRVYGVAWRWLIASAVFSLLALVTIRFPQLLATLEKSYSIGFTILLILGAMGSFVLLWQYSSRKQVFYSRQEKIPLFDIWVGQPNGKTFRNYVKFLKKSILQVQSKSALSSDQQLSGEMKMLRRLVDEKVISQNVYEKAKANLFKKF